MTKVNKVAESAETNKAATYIQLAKGFDSQAAAIAETSDLFRVKMAAKEVTDYTNQAINADCEFTAYTAAHSAEGWLKKVIDWNN